MTDDTPTPDPREAHRAHLVPGCPWCEALAARPALDVLATFPLDLDAFVAGIDSPNHSAESRKAWIALFFRHMKAARSAPDTRYGDSTATQHRSDTLGPCLACEQRDAARKPHAD